MFSLGDITGSIALTRIQSKFSWDISKVKIKFLDSDGPGGHRGRTSGRLISSSRTIFIDPVDVPFENGFLRLNHPGALETLLHELIHCDQAKRGLFFRIKMLWWNWTKEYEERPHEIEARTNSKVWVSQI